MREKMFDVLTCEEIGILGDQLGNALHLQCIAGDEPKAYAGPTMVDEFGNDQEDEVRFLLHDLRNAEPHEHDHTPPIAVIVVLETQVKIHANDDQEQYEARINGAVCAVQPYDGIRMDSNDPEFPAFLESVFRDGAQRARGRYVRSLGPIYV